MARKFIVYGLLDPRSGMVRYIGKSMNGIQRAYSHWKGRSLQLTDHCHLWIKKLIQEGLVPDVVISVANQLREMEIEEIRHFSSIGCRLTNSTNGGEGTPGWIPSAETRIKIGNANRGKKRSPETRELLGSVHRGRPKSLETRLKMRAARARWWIATKSDPQKFAQVQKNFSEAQRKS